MSDMEKTEKPTPKRLREAARDGDILQSRDLATALVFAGGVAALVIGGGMLVDACRRMLRAALIFDHRDVAAFAPAGQASSALTEIATPLGILLAVTVAAAVAAPAMLGSLAFRAGLAAPKWKRINPAAGLKRMFGTAGLGELGKSLLKVVLVAALCVGALRIELPTLVALSSGDPASSGARAGVMIVTALAVGAAALGLIALIDLPWQVFQRAKRLAMSRDEVMREHRESEGSPELKQARRSRQYALAAGSARKAMQDATVVLTNPTHFAVALRYDPARDAVPIVVARGADDAAAAIRDLAKGADVPALAYPALARALFFTSKVGDPVRPDLYLATATVLAFVMQLESALLAGRTQPEVEVPPAMRFDSKGRREA